MRRSATEGVIRSGMWYNGITNNRREAPVCLGVTAGCR